MGSTRDQRAAASLAVEYSSEAGVGLLGPRWQLSGLSSITRCAKTLAQDGKAAPVEFSGDTFCLDGQRLIRLSPTGLEFRTERESFTKIVGSLDQNGDFSKFVVYQADGRVLYYGQTPRSRLHGLPSGASREVNYAFYVDQIQDRRSNNLIIEYLDYRDSAAAAVQELVPVRMFWGSTGRSSIDFEYAFPFPGGAVTPIDATFAGWPSAGPGL